MNNKPIIQNFRKKEKRKRNNSGEVCYIFLLTVENKQADKGKLWFYF